MKYTIRRYEPSDENQILMLLKSTVGESPTVQFTPEFWQWKHFQNPFGASYAILAYDEDSSKVIGLRAFMRWQFRLGDRVLQAVRAVDTATHRDYHRMGIFSNLTKRAVEDVKAAGVDFVFNTPNQYSMPGYLKMGWHYVAKIQPLVKNLNYPRVAAGLLRYMLGVKGPDTFASEDFFRLKATPVKVLLEKEDQLKKLIDSDVQLNEGLIQTDRSWAYLNWRYGRHPYLNYYSVFIEEKGQLKGCLIFRPNVRYNLREVIVNEMLLLDRKEELVRQLFSTLKTRLEVDYLIAYFSGGEFYRKALRTQGFVRVPRLGMNLTVNVLNRNLGQDPRMMENWALALGDLEIF